MAFTTIPVSPRRLNAEIKSKHFSKADFVRAVGASKESVLKWTDEEVESVGVKPEFFRKIIDVLGVTAESIQPDAAGIAPTVYLPVPEWRADIRASHWVEIPVCGDDASDLKQMALRQLGRFRLVVVGDCMEPPFRDGDRVEFRVIEWGEESLIPGAPYAICKSDGLATFKLFDHDEEDALIFRAANPKYKDLLRVPVQEIGRIAIAEGTFNPIGAANSDDARIAALARENAALRGIDPLEMLETMKDVASKDHRNRPAPRRQRRQTNARR